MIALNSKYTSTDEIIKAGLRQADKAINICTFCDKIENGNFPFISKKKNEKHLRLKMFVFFFLSTPQRQKETKIVILIHFVQWSHCQVNTCFHQ